MSVINAVAQLLAAGGDYQISRSVRLRSSASAYLSKTFGTAGNRKKWTYSAWIKRGALGTYGGLIASKVDGNNYSSLEFSGDELRFVQASGGSITVNKKPAGVFRDPSAWYHIVAVMDTDNATAEDRFILYKNGERVTVWAANTPPALGLSTGYINSTTAQWIGLDANPLYFDGLIADVNFIDGLAVPASSFGETDPITGVWKPKKYGGSFGTNGFKLDFSDPSAATAAAIGKDNSGNGNNWTPNNISVTAGVTYDSMLDVPTLWADGGNGRGNYAVLNPLAKSASITVSNANLAATASTFPLNILSSIALPSSGKFYAELSSSSATNGTIGIGFGVQSPSTPLSGDYNAAGAYKFYASASAYVVSNGTITAISSGYTNSANQTFKIAADVDSGKVWLGQNGTWWDSAGGTTGDPSTGANPTFTVAIADFFIVAHFNSTVAFTWTANFGQRPFAYTPPTGFKALNTQNLPDATIKKGDQYFDTTVYAGNSSTQSIVNSGAMQPDLVWIKDRSTASAHRLVDSARGATIKLSSDSTAAEATEATGVTSINANGFSLGSNVAYNSTGRSYAAWQWKESASAGFDIVTYTGDNVSGRTIAHSLGVKPKMMIVKLRTGNASTLWFVYHEAVSATPQNDYLLLHSTAAKASALSVWNNTAPTSSVFSLGNDSSSNATGGTYVAYLFAEVAGYSAFGKYTGNGSADGPFVFLGFRPKFVMVKRTDTTGDWVMVDTSRDTYNYVNSALYADSSISESSVGAGPYIDALSNGFKNRSTFANWNASGGTYIFAAFAENPFKNSLAR